MAHVKGHKRGCKCAICGRGKKGTKKSAKRSSAKRSAAASTKKRATSRKGTAVFLTGFRDGESDIKHGKPLRKVHGRSDYTRGYREGVRAARNGKK